MKEHFLHLLADKLREHGDAVSAGKLGDLKRKVQEDKLSLAFCGHFSAGKSTLINRLCGHRLLPSSPIPTSANVVTIRSGEAEARVMRRVESGLVTEQVSLEELEAACKDGETIESVEIRYPIPLLGEHAVLLDTPGVDSTDEAHMRATESALHVADVVFYVMDYNHVLSELNFSFVKRLKSWGKPVYLIVNQIDKHREAELPFEAYAAGVRDSFAEWGIAYDGIVFLSMKEPEHPLQEVEKLLWLIAGLIDRRTALIRWNATGAARQTIREHMENVRAEHADERERLQREAAGAEGEALLAAYREAEQEREKLRDLPDRQAEQWQAECQRILDNANVTPAATRDLAQAYLEARKPGFRIGLFGSATKTAAEIERRLSSFTAGFGEQVRANIVWHLQAELKRAAESNGLQLDTIKSELAQLETEVAPDWLAGQVAAGAVVSGEYTLNYAKQISAEIKTMYRKWSLAAIETLKKALARRCSEEIEGLEAELSRLNRELRGYRELESLERSEHEYEDALNRLIPEEEKGEPPLPDLQAYASKPERAGDAGNREASLPLRQSGEALAQAVLEGDRGEEPSEQTAAPLLHRTRFLEAAARLRAAASLLGGLPGLQSVRDSLLGRADKLATNRFTVALFGAFSAGKSSFANALIGERLLPVSPNPTTAAINTIVPPTERSPHGTATVRIKREAALREEIRHSLSMIGLPDVVPEELPGRLAAIKPEHLSPAAKPHHTFLQAIAGGWERMRERFSAELQVGLDEFADYVAEEANSCFVDAIELHYAHPLAEQGIVLVDTPGADSIHARHTGVAFGYLKNADAILFVTYYNHAFSQADREFLLQLGRVKDALELDKMFFLVNAADLAESRDELEDVCRHVETNLLRHGIRHPRLYPVSSQLAVEAKRSGRREQLSRSGFASFEADFHRFVFEELGGMALRAAEAELVNAVRLTEELRKEAAADEAERDRLRRRLEENAQEAQRLLEEDAGVDPADLKELEKEVRELLFYVKQRVGFRYGEWFNLAFNPSSLREDGRDMKAALRSSWTELNRLVSVGLSQEVLATTLRAEQAARKLAEAERVRTAGKLARRLPGFLVEPEASYPPAATPDVDEELPVPPLEEKKLYASFRSGRAFFEGDGKDKLRAELEPMIANAVALYCERHADVLTTYYTVLYRNDAAGNRERLKQAMHELLERRRSALEQTIEVDRLEEIRMRLLDLAKA